MKEEVTGNYLEPSRLPIGERVTFLLYTESEGDTFHVLSNFVDMEGFLQIKKQGYFDVRLNTIKPKRIYPAFVCFAIGIEGHDFILQKMNRDQKRQP